MNDYIASQMPLYVLKIDPYTHEIVVGFKSDMETHHVDLENVELTHLDRNIVQPISFEVVVEHGCTD